MKKIVLEINGKDYAVEIDRVGQFDADIKVNERSYHVGLKDLGQEKKVEAVRPVIVNQPTASPASAPVVQNKPKPSIGGGKVVTAPLPGLVLSIPVKVGDQVKRGQLIMILEAMKMENDIPAEMDGVVKEIKVKAGETVVEGDTLLTLE
ncbi:MAG: biotin/lipoyl-binding protein [Candidatus Delongbacteria bacterium]|nr:biotin/lipoyl-binding protein [Candidatus Delongbacteria bacterium]MBN2835758.1 biotin/lipoyl-binding protein [Candidatus Delongbacteria bacterium]